MVRLAYSTNAYTRFSLEEAIKSIHALAYDGVEILADVPHLWGKDATHLASRIGKAVACQHLSVSNINANTCRGALRNSREGDTGPTFVSARMNERYARRMFLDTLVLLAGDLGGDTLSLTSGPRDPNDGGRGREWFVEALRGVLEQAEKHDLRIGIEYEPGFLIGDLTSLRSVLEEVNHPLLGANLDLGHAQVVGDDPAEAIRALKGRIWNMHVEDIRGRVHHHLVPGEGDMDWRAIRAAIEETGYDGFLTVELYTCADDPEGAGRRALHFLRDLFNPPPGVRNSPTRS